MQSIRDWYIGKETRPTVLYILLAEVVSLASYYHTDLQPILFWVLLLLIGGVSLTRLEYGVAAILAELAIGSKGYLFAFEFGGINISLRLGLFLVVCAAWAYQYVRDTRMKQETPITAFFHTRWSDAWIGLVVVVMIGGVMGVVQKNPIVSIFLDGNGFLFLGLAPVCYAVTATKERQQLLMRIIVAAVITSFIKTLVILFVFAHALIGITPELYTWVRQTGVGEISTLESYVRVFFQSHIYALFLFFTILTQMLWGKKGEMQRFLRRERGILIVFTIVTTLILVSLSRSFFVAGLLVGVGLLLITKWKWKRSWGHIASVVGVVSVAGIIGFVLFYGVVNFPLGGSGGSTTGLISERTTDIGEEAAASSRWNLLPRLLQKNLQSPLLGAGFGTAVTYETADPRFIDTHGHNTISTFSFEWGYLDIWLKMGIVGLILWIGVPLYVSRMAKRVKEFVPKEDQGVYIGLAVTIIVLLCVHATTPYLNHPLGLGWFIFVASVIMGTHERKRMENPKRSSLPASPQVHIQIVTFNSKGCIDACLDSIRQQTYQNYTISILDSASSDGTFEYIQEQYPEIQNIRSEENVGYVVGQNRLLQQTSADIIFTLNPDTQLSPTYVEMCVKKMVQAEDIAAVQGNILRLKDGVPTTYIDSTGLRVLPNWRVIERKGGEEQDTQNREAEEVAGVTGAATLYRRDALLDLQEMHGYVMDEKFFMYKDDIDLSFRMKLRGWHIYTTPAAIGYHERWTTGSEEGASKSQIAQKRTQKPEWMRIRSTTNHWRVLIKNVYWRTLFLQGWRILWIECVKIGYMLVNDPIVLGKASLAFMKDIPVLLRQRRAILDTSCLQVDQQYTWTRH